MSAVEEQTNIVKRACKELGITQKELEENADMRIEVAKNLILKSSVHDSDVEYADIVSNELENINSEKDVRNILEDVICNPNIIKRACKKLNLTQKELAELIGYSESAVNNASRTDVSYPMTKAIELYIKTIEQEKELQTLSDLKKILQNLVK